MTVFDRVKFLADKQGMSIAEVEEKVGMGRNAIYKWKKQKAATDKLEKVADLFNVSVDYLLGRTDSPDWAAESDVLDLEKMLNEEVGMTFGGEALTDEQKQRVKDILTVIFWEEREKKNKK